MAPPRCCRPSSNNAYGGLGEMAGPFVRTGWRALLAADILQKLLLAYRPHELEAGRSESVYEICLADVCRTIESTPVKPAVQLAALRDALVRCRDRFRAIPGRRDRTTPLIGIVGEIFCRLNTFSNENLVRRAGRIRRRSVAFRHRGMDLVHRFGALPQAQADRPAVDRRGAWKPGSAIACRSATSTCCWSLSARISRATRSRTCTRSWNARDRTCRAKARSARWC